ncbi:MAG: hypothetical protein JXA67_02645 [Micromonosporaceae bacterium]|nr:hypothetical protein [Micromonosporaceae bacterium]
MTTRFSYPPRSSRGAILGFSSGQIMLCVTGVIAGVIAVNLLALGQQGPAAALLGLAVVLLAAGLLRWRGRRATAWVPILAGVWVQRLVRQDRYRGGIFAGDGHQLDLPGPAAGYRWLEAMAADGKTRIGLLDHRTERTITAVLPCSGANFLLSGSERRDQRLADWAAVLNVLGAEYGSQGLLRWALTARTVPGTTTRLRQHLDSRVVDTTTAAYRSLRAVTTAVGTTTVRREVHLSVVFDRARLSGEITAAGGDDAAAAVVVCERLASIERAVADAGVTTHGWAPPRVLAGLLRSQFDPDDQSVVDAQGGVAPHLAGPTAAEQVGWDVYRHDSAVSQTLWVYEMPRRVVGATWLTPLYAHGVGRRTVTLVAQPVPAGVANLASRRERVASAGDATTKRRLRLVRTAREDAEAAAVEQIDREQAAGHVRYRYALLVTVTASSSTHLHRDVQEVKRLLGRAGCAGVVLHGEQDQAFAAAALPLARGLAPMRGWLG